MQTPSAPVTNPFLAKPVLRCFCYSELSCPCELPRPIIAIPSTHGRDKTIRLKHFVVKRWKHVA
ncbi:hypothetical protein A2U01_0061457, partial [Trifolium medium]|nr:hypothetical protein [Trifolium medium]